jgi:hypothetical protein
MLPFQGRMKRSRGRVVFKNMADGKRRFCKLIAEFYKYFKDRQR